MSTRTCKNKSIRVAVNYWLLLLDQELIP